ncbi:MAG: RNA polymerase sigma factor, partial [Dehalococcoidia bacterium]
MALAPEDAAYLDTLSDTPDATLLVRAQGGDDDAFTEVVQRYETRLRSYLTRLLNDADLAADVLQETLLDLYRSWGTRAAPPHPVVGDDRRLAPLPQPPPGGGSAPGTLSTWETRAVPQPPPDGGSAPGTPELRGPQRFPNPIRSGLRPGT